MKKQILGLLIIVMIFNIESLASKPGSLEYKKIKIGNNNSNDKDITAKVYYTPFSIDQFHINSDNSEATFWLKNNRLLKYNLKKQHLVWDTYFNDYLDAHEYIDDHLLYSKNDTIYCLNPNTLKKKWKTNKVIFYVDPTFDLALAFRLRKNGKPGKNLYGINMKNGKKKWRVKLENRFGFNGLDYLNDSTLLLSVAGLQCIDLRNGKGWKHFATTGEFKPAVRASAGGPSFLSSFFAEAFSSAIAGDGESILGNIAADLTYSVVANADADRPPREAEARQLVNGICSNILVDGDYIYYASKNDICKLKKNGQIIWRRILNSKLTTASHLFLKNDTLVMVNYGNGRLAGYGAAYMIGLNIKKGKKVFFVAPSKERSDYIKSFTTKGDHIYFYIDDRIAKYSLKNGAYMGEASTKKFFRIKSINTETKFVSRSFKSFVSKGECFISVDGKLKDIHSVYKDGLIVRNTSGSIYILDENFHIKDFILNSKQYKTKMIFENSVLVHQGTQYYLINHDSNIISSFYAYEDLSSVGDKLYFATKNKLYEIKLEDIIQ